MIQYLAQNGQRKPSGQIFLFSQALFQPVLAHSWCSSCPRGHWRKKTEERQEEIRNRTDERQIVEVTEKLPPPPFIPLHFYDSLNNKIKCLRIINKSISNIRDIIGTHILVKIQFLDLANVGS